MTSKPSARGLNECSVLPCENLVVYTAQVSTFFPRCKVCVHGPRLSETSCGEKLVAAVLPYVLDLYFPQNFGQ